MKQVVVNVAEKPVQQPVRTVRKFYDPEYEAWKKANGLDRRICREEFVKEFNPCGLPADCL